MLDYLLGVVIMGILYAIVTLLGKLFKILKNSFSDVSIAESIKKILTFVVVISCVGGGLVYIYDLAQEREDRAVTDFIEKHDSSIKERLNEISLEDEIETNGYSKKKDVDVSVTEEAEEIVTCPMCRGVKCYFCLNKGVVTKAEAAKAIYLIMGGKVRDIYPEVLDATDDDCPSKSDGVHCPSCNGTGYCNRCDGIGVVYFDGEYGEAGGYDVCPRCHGVKKCQYCGGTGR